MSRRPRHGERAGTGSSASGAKRGRPLRSSATLPCVLLVDPDHERRRTLGLVLSADGWEVVPAVDGAEGARLAGSLAPAIVVAPAALADEEPLLGGSGGAGRRLLLGDLSGPVEAGESGAAMLPVGGLREVEVAKRLRRMLLSISLGLAPDRVAGSLSGELRSRSTFELLRVLAHHGASARVELPGGTVELRDGEVVAARAGQATGLKAFCRIVRRTEGRLRVVFVEGPAPQRELHDDLDSLIEAAIEDAMGEAPPSGTRFRVELGEGFFQRPFSVLEREILEAAQQGSAFERIVDASPLPDAEVVREILGLERLGALVRSDAVRPPVIVTVPGADLPPELAARLGIELVSPPAALAAAEKRPPDAAQLEPGPFYRVWEGLPESAEGDLVGLWAERFEALLDERAVVALLPSAQLSKAVVHARTAAHRLGCREGERFGPERGRLTILETGQAGLALGLLAIFAARLARRGRDAQQISRRIVGMGERLRSLMLVDRLEFLASRKRVGRLRARAARLFGSKPILGLAGGRVVTVSRTFGRQAAVGRLFELAVERLAPQRPAIVGLTHARATAAAEELRRLLDGRLRVTEWILGETGPALEQRVGPGSVGLALYQPTVEEAPLIAPLT